MTRIALYTAVTFDRDEIETQTQRENDVQKVDFHNKLRRGSPAFPEIK